MSEYEPLGFELGSVMTMYNAMGHDFKQDVGISMSLVIMECRQSLVLPVDVPREHLAQELASTPIKN